MAVGDFQTLAGMPCLQLGASAIGQTYLIGLQSVPKVALAPIILVWLGTGIESKLAIVWLVAFFPIIVDTVAGLRSTPRELLELARSLRATLAERRGRRRVRGVGQEARCRSAGLLTSGSRAATPRRPAVRDTSRLRHGVHRCRSRRVLSSGVGLPPNRRAPT